MTPIFLPNFLDDLGFLDPHYAQKRIPAHVAKGAGRRNPPLRGGSKRPPPDGG